MSIMRAWKEGKNSSCCFTLTMMLENKSKEKENFSPAVKAFDIPDNMCGFCVCEPVDVNICQQIMETSSVTRGGNKSGHLVHHL